MKKIIIMVLTILGLAATALCFVFPVQAKEVSNNISEFLNTPYMIAGTSITLGGILTFVISKFIVNNTKFGRKEINTVKEDFKELKEAVGENEKSVERTIALYTEKYMELEEKCNTQVTVMLDQFEDMQNKVLTALEAIPNRKVQLIVSEYKSNYEAKKQEIINKTINTNEYIDEKLAEMKKQFDEFMEKLSHEKEENDQTTEE